MRFSRNVVSRKVVFEMTIKAMVFSHDKYPNKIGHHDSVRFFTQRAHQLSLVSPCWLNVDAKRSDVKGKNP